MSTRCNILVGNRQFYHHHDGYPEGVGADLAYAIANFNEGKPRNPWHDHMRSQEGPLYAFGEYLSRGIPGRLGKGISGHDDRYESEENGLHGDIEFLYLVNAGMNGKLSLYCVDIYRDLGGMRGLESIWNLPPEQLFAMFAKPKYRFELPSISVPVEEQVYSVEGNVGYEQARALGLDEELSYGDSTFNGVSIARVRNARHVADCGQCGTRLERERNPQVREEYPWYCPNCGNSVDTRVRKKSKSLFRKRRCE